MTVEHPKRPPTDPDARLAPVLRPRPEQPTVHLGRPKAVRQGVSAMTETTRLISGAVVTYFDPRPSSANSFGRAAATGPEVIDPRTNEWWAPVMLPDQTVDLLPSMLIVGIVPGTPAPDDTA